MTFTIDLEKMQNLNGNKTEAFFNYIKNVSKNKTPIVLQGCKKENYWDCRIVECAVPVSILYQIKLPADDDTSAEGTTLTFQLTNDIIGQLVDKTKFTFKEDRLEIKRDRLKVNCSLTSSKESLDSQVEDYMELLTKQDPALTDLKVSEGTDLAKLLKELRSSPEASIFVTPESITLIKDSVLFRIPNNESVSLLNEELYINMYMANTILKALEYSHSVQVIVTYSNIAVIGYAEDGTVYTKSISAVFDPLSVQNPTDEDLKGIMPTDSAETISIDLANCIESLEAQKSAVSAFIVTRNWEASLSKNGNGASFKFSNNENGTLENGNSVVINVGEVAMEDPENFTDYSTILPLELFKNFFEGSLNLNIIFDKEDYSAVLFKVGDSEIFSGKIF